MAAELRGKPRLIGVADERRHPLDRLAGGRQQADRPVQPQLLHVAGEAHPPPLAKQPGQVAGARPRHVLGEKHQRRRLGQVQFQIGARPLKGIVRQ